jgi:hypothetical protein
VESRTAHPVKKLGYFPAESEELISPSQESADVYVILQTINFQTGIVTAASIGNKSEQ